MNKRSLNEKTFHYNSAYDKGFFPTYKISKNLT